MSATAAWVREVKTKAGADTARSKDWQQGAYVCNVMNTECTGALPGGDEAATTAIL